MDVVFREVSPTLLSLVPFCPLCPLCPFCSFRPLGLFSFSLLDSLVESI